MLCIIYYNTCIFNTVLYTIMCMISINNNSRRQESSGPPEGNLPDVPAKNERKDVNRTDPPDKR